MRRIGLCGTLQSSPLLVVNRRGRGRDAGPGRLPVADDETLLPARFDTDTFENLWRVWEEPASGQAENAELDDTAKDGLLTLRVGSVPRS